MGRVRESSITSPPPRPQTTADRDFEKGLRLSLVAHGILISVVVVKNLIFPSTPIPYIPTLRVDIVGLPDLLKNERAQQPPPGAPAQPEQAKKEEAAKPEPKSKEEVADAEEMVLKAKKAREKAEQEKKLAEQAKEKEKEKNEKDRKKKISNALARIKALAKITGEQQPSEARAGTLIKGNKVSAGSSLSGDARESSEANYYDSVRARLQESWALPVWLARQKFSAQVQIYIDSRGNLRNYRFMKLSGNPQFDDLVKKAIVQSQPFPLPPEKLAGSLLVDGILVGFPL